MVIDTSALMAILLGEPERDEFIELIASHTDPVVSAATLVEARMVASARLGPRGSARVDELLRAGEVRTVAFDELQADEAHKAWQVFGRGNGPARLNFGDCLAYALARSSGRPLLYKGDDFARTDIESARSG